MLDMLVTNDEKLTNMVTKYYDSSEMYNEIGKEIK